MTASSPHSTLEELEAELTRCSTVVEQERAVMTVYQAEADAANRRAHEAFNRYMNAMDAMDAAMTAVREAKQLAALPTLGDA